MLDNAKREKPVKTRKLEKALLKACKSAPGPSAVEALAEHYLRCYKFDKAREAVEDGLLRYPESQKLRLLERRIKRTDLYGDFLKANNEITANPSPDAHANLAALYRAVGDIDKALDACARGLAAYADSVRLYLNVAELRIRRFAKNFMPKDAVIALANLEKAVSLNENDYAVSILLAEFYLAIGASEAAIGILKKILVTSPADEHAQKLLENALETTHKDEPVEDLVREVSAARRLAVNPEMLKYLEKCTRENERPAAERNVDLEQMKGALAEALRSTDGRAMVILDPKGAIAAAAAREDAPLDIDAFAAAAREIRDNTNDYALRMDLGNFENGEIEGPFGHLLVYSVERWLIAGITPETPSNRERMRKRMLEVAEDCILTAPAAEPQPAPEQAQPEQGA
jgi:tetratricopeptide (TPR) repeat protein